MQNAIADSFRLDGRVAIVTGASSGLGAAIALAMAQMGADVALLGRRTERLRELARQISVSGRQAQVVTCDVVDPDQCARAVGEVLNKLGRPHVLVNNAGVGAARPATRETPEEFTDVVRTNLFGTYWMAQEAARVMPAGGAIINVSSVLALTTASLPQAAYTSSKAAVIGLTRDLAQQWSGRKGIRVNAIAPGYFETEMTENYDSEYVSDYLLPRIVIGRAGNVAEAAATAVWLASPAAGYVTGQTIVIDGGLTLT